MGNPDLNHFSARYGFTVPKRKTNNEFITRVATDTKEACKLIEAGLEYVTGECNDGGKIFRR